MLNSFNKDRSHTIGRPNAIVSGCEGDNYIWAMISLDMIIYYYSAFHIFKVAKPWSPANQSGKCVKEGPAIDMESLILNVIPH